MCTTNHALGSENQELHDLKNKTEGKMQQIKAVVAEKEEKLKSAATEHERTQKTLCLLNNGTNRLEHLITSSKLLGNHSGVSFKVETTSIKTMFINIDYLLILLMPQIISQLSNLLQ